MRIEDILKLDFDKQLTKLKECAKDADKSTWQKEYNGEHAILTEPDRQPETVGEDDNRRTVKKAKEIITFQKKIVGSTVNFLFGEPVQLVLENKDKADDSAFDLFVNAWKECKLDYFNRKLMRAVCIESEAAELWYTTDDKNGGVELGVKLLCQKNGDEIYPHFNENGKMDAFLRMFTWEDETGKEYDRADIYTDTRRYIAIRKESQWTIDERANLFKKIPVVYYQQEKPEWYDVQTLIDRMEMMISKLADENDYYAHPVLKLWGKVKIMPKKQSDGKTLVFDADEDSDGKLIKRGDAEYLFLEQAPEAWKLEFEKLMQLIEYVTATPNLSFENVKGNANVTGIALKLMFLDPLLKAKGKQEIYGEGLDRRINVLRAILKQMNIKMAQKIDELNISVKFQSVLPDNIKETIENLVTATGGEPIISQRTAVRNNPYVEDATEEMEELEKSGVKSLGESYEIE